MKFLCLSIATLFAFTTAISSSFPAFTAATSPSLAVTPSDAATPPPPPTDGESAGQWIDQLFDDTNSTSYNTSSPPELVFSNINISRVVNTASAPGGYNSKRSYEEGNGLHESTWTNDTANIAYNISVDFSKCSTGIRYSTDVGVYTFTNGTTTNSTTLEDLVADVWTLRHSRSTPNTRYANHTAVVAQLALNEANALLDKGLICKNKTQNAAAVALRPPEDEIIHEELRHLLANSYSYWTSVILSSGSGAAAGAAIAAGLDYKFKGNVTAQNTIQTAAVVAVAILAAGILNRMHEVGHLDNAQPLAQGVAQGVAQGAQRIVPENIRQLVPAGREAVVQNVWLGWCRRAMQRVMRRQEAMEQQLEIMEEALSEAGVSIPDESARNSVENPGLDGGMTSVGASSQATEPGTVADLEACLDEVGAAQAAAAVGDMTSGELTLETIHEVQEQRQQSGSCGV
ncbi:hypothetical protein N7G274_008089 [Stereocaulon virgatum]|uniref:Uncharacterized protein n=1 Tax=Stereocaulon virgatum TaxID=373712 RepID=A0ABR4A0Q8_9LECA